MSKAMEALDYVSKHCTPWQRPDFAECITTLRDYITTTEAAGLVSGDVETLLDEIRKEAYTAAEFERFSSHEILAAIEKRHDTNVALLAAFIAKQEAASAARIKELEEALKTLDSRGGLGLDVHKWLREIIDKAALSGARKVNSLGSVRGDEHLGAMLPDGGARKVEPEYCACEGARDKERVTDGVWCCLDCGKPVKGE